MGLFTCDVDLFSRQKKIDLKRSKSQSLDEENGPSPPLHKKQWFSNSLRLAAFFPRSSVNPQIPLEAPLAQKRAYALAAHALVL
ncbi:hypothetical protein J27TS7_45560 [Paenibacillus dendritiformis]|uniref:hypothetical protein n=1 Tax=Paenibacillus dendritiformis TaxID=130049 RepID=UPI001B265DFB|nr:hypothetical protein [Paenibacillus dendritiformis]GIO75042.1 hypothetical protein J27TS7_45560 [Paenibacillus dendritiformis]